MAGFYGDFLAKTVRQGAVNVLVSSWTPLVSSGSTPLNNRRHLRIFIRGKIGSAVAVAYSGLNADGTFTTPSPDIRLTTVFPGNSIWIEPISDKVNVYGKMLRKIGNTDNSVRVIVTEYA